jgi:hypothetical protein
MSSLWDPKIYGIRKLSLQCLRPSASLRAAGNNTVHMTLAIALAILLPEKPQSMFAVPLYRKNPIITKPAHWVESPSKSPI